LLKPGQADNDAGIEEFRSECKLLRNIRKLSAIDLQNWKKAGARKLRLSS
jgi:hypothetical protein